MEALRTPDEVAERLGIPPATLAQWRHRRVGPRFMKLIHAVRYRDADVDAFVDASMIETGMG